MLDFLFNGLYKIISAAVGGLLSAFMEAFKVDLTGFKDSFPGLDTLFGVLQGISFGLLLMIIFYTCLKNIYTPAGDKIENPLWVALKAIPAAFLIINANSVVNIVFEIGAKGYDLISAAVLDVEWGGAVISAIGSFSIGLVAPGIAGASALLGLILFLFFAYHLLKFLLECVERYVTVCIACYISPLSYCAIASKGTISFFSNFCSMLAGQMLLVWINAWSLKMIAAGLEGLSQNTTVEGPGFFFKYMLLIAFTIVAQKMDNLLQQLGFHNIRGGGGNAMMMGAGIVSMAASRAIGGVQNLAKGMNKAKAGSNAATAGKPVSDTTKQTSGIGRREDGASGQVTGSSSAPKPKATTPKGEIVSISGTGASGQNSAATTSNAPKTVSRKPADTSAASGMSGKVTAPTSSPTAPSSSSAAPRDTTGAASDSIGSKSSNEPDIQTPIDTTGANATIESSPAGDAPTSDTSDPVDTTASAGSISAPTDNAPMDSGNATVNIGSSPVSHASSETVNASNTAVSADTTGGDSVTIQSRPEASPAGNASTPVMTTAPHAAASATPPSRTASAPTVNPRTPVGGTPDQASRAKTMVHEAVQQHQAAAETKRISTMEQQTPSAQRHATDIQQGRAGHSPAKPPRQDKKK